jgi:putative transposase
MDGIGRAVDNIFIERLWRKVKYVNIYLSNYEDGVNLYKGLVGYFDLYNQERLHQSLGYQTPKSHFQLSYKLMDLQHNYSQHQLTNSEEILS